MYLNIAGLDKAELLTHLSRYALRHLSQIDPSRGEEYRLQLEALRGYEGPFSHACHLPFLPPGSAPWVDLRGDVFNPIHYDIMCGEGAAARVVAAMRRAHTEEESGAAATSTKRHGYSGDDESPPHKRGRPGGSGGGGEGPSTSMEGAGCSGGSSTEGHQR